MPLLTLSRRNLLTLAGAALLPAPAVHAQRAFPNRPIRLVVAFAPGGNSYQPYEVLTFPRHLR